MSNSFSKEERVAFEDILEGFNDALVLSRNVSIYNTDGSMMERTNNVIYRPPTLHRTIVRWHGPDGQLWRIHPAFSSCDIGLSKVCAVHSGRIGIA